MKPMFKPFQRTDEGNLSTYYDIVTGCRSALELTYQNRILEEQQLLSGYHEGAIDRLVIGALALLAESMERDIEKGKQK